MKKKLLFVDLAICSLWMLSALGGRDSWEQPVFALSVLGVMTRFVVSFPCITKRSAHGSPLGFSHC